MVNNFMNLNSSKNWKTVKLDEVTSFISRGVAPSYVEFEGVVVLNQKCIRDWNVSFGDSRRTDKFSKEKLLKNDDILICSTGVGTLGRVAQIDFLKEDTTVDSHVSIVRPDPEKVSPKFLGYFLKKSEKTIESMAEGSTGQTELPRAKLKEFQFSTPESIEDQKEIADMLGSLDDKIDLLRRENKTLENIAQTLFKEWFVNFNFPGSTGKMVDSDLGKIPEGWRVRRLKDMVEIKNGFAFKSEDYIQDKQYPIIRTMNFEDSRYINSNNLVYISYEKAKEYEGFNLEEFDLCVVMVGASLGNIAMVTKINLPALQNQNMWSFKPKNKDFRFYVNFQIKNIVKNNVNSASGSARDFFRKDHFYNIDILTPKDSIIFEFEKMVYPLYQKISNNIIEIKTLCNLRDELLNKIFE